MLWAQRLHPGVRVLQRLLVSSPDQSDPHDKDREPPDVAESIAARWQGKMGFRSQDAEAGYRVIEKQKVRVREFLIGFPAAKEKKMGE